MGGVGKSSGTNQAAPRPQPPVRRAEKYSDPLRQYIYEQGWDKKPTLKIGAEFDKAVKESPYPMLVRGISADSEDVLRAYDTSFKSGEWFLNSAGGRAYGPGMYTAMKNDSDRGDTTLEGDAVGIAISYARKRQQGALVRMCFKKGAKIATFKQYRQDNPSPIRQKYYNKVPTDNEHMKMLQWAKQKGYDGMVVLESPFGSYTVVYNRGSLVVDKEFHRVN